MMRKRKSKVKFNGFYLLTGIIIGVVIFYLCSQVFIMLEAWAKYDPEQAAVEKITACITKNTVDCGYVTMFDCWSEIIQLATQESFTTDALWYNHEDKICCRGGDEVYVQVNFSGGDAFNVLWYEGAIEYCEIVPI